MIKIGVALAIPSLDKLLKKHRNKYNKYNNIEPHMTVYHSDFKGYNLKKLEKLVEKIKNHSKKIVINKLVKRKKFIYLNVENWYDYSKLRKEITSVFGKEEAKPCFHITIGYNVSNSEFKEIQEDINPHLPITIEAKEFVIVIMDFASGKMESKKYCV